MAGMDPLAPVWTAEMPSRPTLVAVHSGFVATGMVTTLLGPLLPVLAARWALSDAQAGALFLVQFAGATVAAILVGGFLPQRGFRFSLTLGSTLMCVGVGALGFGSLPSAVLALFCAGAGQGVAITVSNLFVADANPHRSAAALSLLNFSWGVGAVAWPFLVAIGVRLGHVNALLLALSATLGLIALWMARLPFTVLSKRNLSVPFLPRADRLDLRTFFLFGTMFLLYVGVEGASGGWVASQMKRMTPTTAEMWVLPASFFWGSLMAGRALASIVLRRLREQTLLYIELLLATCGLVLLFFSSTSAAVMAGASLTGFGLSGVFPILVSSLKRTLGDSSSRFAGLHFALGGIGGATLPWLVGVISTASGSLKTGLLVPLFAWLCLGGLILFGPRSSFQRHQ